jgi:hypothetical protein
MTAVEVNLDDIETWDIDRALSTRWLLRRTAKASRELTETMVIINRRIKELGGA